MGQVVDNSSLLQSETNKERVQQAYSRIEGLLAQSLVRHFNGSICLEVTVKQGTIMNISAGRTERVY